MLRPSVRSPKNLRRLTLVGEKEGAAMSQAGGRGGYKGLELSRNDRIHDRWIGGEGRGGQGATQGLLGSTLASRSMQREEEERGLWRVEQAVRADGTLQGAPSTSSSRLRNGRLREAKSPAGGHTAFGGRAFSLLPR